MVDTPTDADIRAYVDSELATEPILAGFEGYEVLRGVPSGPGLHPIGSEIRIEFATSDLELLAVRSVKSLFGDNTVAERVAAALCKDMTGGTDVKVGTAAGLLGVASVLDSVVLYDARWSTDVELYDPKRFSIVSSTTKFIPTWGLIGEALLYRRKRRPVTRVFLDVSSHVRRTGPTVRGWAAVRIMRQGERLTPDMRVATIE